MSGCSLLRRDRRIGAHGGVAAFIKSTLSHETVVDSISWDDQLEELAFKIYVIVVYRPPNHSFNWDGILIERLQEVTRAANLILVGDFNAPNVNWKDITASSHELTFHARLLSFCLDNFFVQHSVLATRSV